MSSRLDSIYRSYDQPRSREKRRSRSRSMDRRRDRRETSRDREREREKEKERIREWERTRERDRNDSHRNDGRKRSRSRSRDQRRSRERSSSKRTSPPSKTSRYQEEPKSSSTPTPTVKDGFVFTPFGAYKVQSEPNPREFVFEPGSGYFFDNKTGNYMDPNSGYYFDPSTKEWNFWSPLYSTYIPCESGNIEWKKSLQILEKEDDFLRMARSNSPSTVIKIFEQFKDYVAGDENGDHTYSSFTKHQEDLQNMDKKSASPLSIEKPEPWMCTKCDTENGVSRKNCFKCGSKKEPIEDYEARGAHLIGSEPTDTLLIRDFPSGLEESQFRKWVIDLFGSVVKNFYVADSNKYYLVQVLSIEKAEKSLYEINNAFKQINMSVKLNFSKKSLNDMSLQKSSVHQNNLTAPPHTVAPLQTTALPALSQNSNSTLNLSQETRRLPSHATGSWISNSKPTTILTSTPMKEPQSITKIAETAAQMAAPTFTPIVSIPNPIIVYTTNTQKLFETTSEIISVIHSQKEFVLQYYGDPYIHTVVDYYATKIQIYLDDFTAMASREKEMGKFAAHPDLIEKAAVILRLCLEQNESLMRVLFERMLLEHKVTFQDFAIKIQTTMNTLLEDGTVKKKVEQKEEEIKEKKKSLDKPNQKPSSSKKSTRKHIKEDSVEYASTDSEDERNRRDGDPTSKTPLTGEDAFSIQLKKFVEDKKNYKKGVELCFNCARLGHKPSECIYAKAPKALLEQMRFLHKVWKDEGKPSYNDIVERFRKKRMPAHKTIDKNKVVLDGRDRLTRQLRALVPDGRVRRTHLNYCKNCAHIGHNQEVCRDPPADSYYVQEMRVLIDLFIKKYRLDDIVVADVRYEDLYRDPPYSLKDESRKPSRTSRERSPLPSAASLNSASSLVSAAALPPPLEPTRPNPIAQNKPIPKPQVPRNSSANFAPNLFQLLNDPSKNFFPGPRPEVEYGQPELNGKDRLSQQLKILAPNGKVTSKLLRLCEKCACVGHKKDNCTYPQASWDEICNMNHLINVYQERYGQMILANDMYEAASVKADVARENSQSNIPKRGPIILDGKDSFSIEVQKVLLREGRLTKTLLKLCNNCGELGHAFKDCKNKKADSDFLYKMSNLRNQYLQKNGLSENLTNEERENLTITGLDPFSKQLNAICPDGLVLKKHLILCMNCAQLGHGENLCKNSWVGEKRVQEMLGLQKQYKETWSAEYKKDMNSYALTGSDPFSLQLKEVAPNRNVTIQNLLVCRSCARLGHKPIECRQPKPWTPEHLAELKKMFAYRRKYMKGVLTGQYPPIQKNSETQEIASPNSLKEEIDEFESDTDEEK